MNYAYNYTSVYKLTYVHHGEEHDWFFRPGISVDPGSGLDLAERWLLAVAPIIETHGGSDFALVKATWQQHGTSFSVPTGTPDPSIVTPNAEPVNARKAVNFLNFQARSSLGGRSGRKIFGITISAEEGANTNFRRMASEDALVAAAVNALNVGPVETAIDRQPISWYPYANYAPSAYWIRQKRG